MRKDIRSSSSPIALAAPFPLPSLGAAMEEVSLSVDRFCLLAGIEALAEMMEEDATAVCGCPFYLIVRTDLKSVSPSSDGSSLALWSGTKN